MTIASRPEQILDPNRSTQMPKDSKTETLDFESAYASLESVVRGLEEDELKLEDALGLYEKGVALTERCGKLLEAAELRVNEIGGGAVEPDSE
jgi:exodeoxyribonuclease VII small subunit